MKQDIINRELLPEIGTPGVKVKDGKIVAYEQEIETILYIGHELETVTDADGNAVEQVRAFAVPVPSPVTRAKAIDAAERAAYGLRSADEVASFNASLARKSRLGEDTDEVADHDNFIAWVKDELDKIGL